MVMTLRTPRRRISPRTKLRYRAIKDFLRRAIGSPSQPDIKINSSIAINVTDLKHKINGLEHQLNEVNKHCQDLAGIETSSKNDCPILVDTEDGTEFASLKEHSDVSSLKKSSVVETKLLFKTPESEYRKSDDSGGLGNLDNDPSSKYTVKYDNMPTNQYANKEKIKIKNKMDDQLKVINESQPNLRKHKTQSAYEKIGSHATTSSCHSLNNHHTPYVRDTLYHGRHYEKKHRQRDCIDPIPTKAIKVKKLKEPSIRRNSPQNVIHYESKRKHKTKLSRNLDEDFIADLIKRQYRPIKIRKRESGMSQISAPVCRDQEYKIREDILEGSDLCSCCIDGRKKNKIYPYNNGLDEKRSICDTKLYSSKNQMRRNHHHRKEVVYNKYDVYNDSEQYDLIPVKEKSSPKSRRKMFIDAPIPHNYYKEVPPSPRTQRPKLNLKAQYFTEFEDYMMHRNEYKRRNYSSNRHRLLSNDFYSNESSDAMVYYKGKRKSQLTKHFKNEQHVQQDIGTMSFPPSPVYHTEQNNHNDNTFNKTQESDLPGNKTDKALSEIKDILQSFLQEIKKETVSVSHCGNSDMTPNKTGDKCINDYHPSSTKLNSSAIPESGLCVNNFSIPQYYNKSPSFIPPYTNPCCYPILPICPMNCMQSGFILPTPSCTCNCVNSSKDAQLNPNESNTAKSGTNTEELIKEIYKFVAQNQNNDLRKDPEKKERLDSSKGRQDDKLLTSRSAGESSRVSKRDVEVATQKVKCHSKSCEAIGSRMTSDTLYSRTNPTYSDTVLERLSLEATASTTGSESSSEQINLKKGIKKNKFTKVLRSFGLLKKKKDVIEEVSESESTFEVSIKAKPPFHQEITNYSMHCQEYCNRPPIPTRNEPYHSCSGSPRGCPHKCPRHGSSTQSPMYECYNNHKLPCGHRTDSPYQSPRPHPSAPPYPNPYGHLHHTQPQVPLCLKEIEVKSTGTQSERKMPFFRRFKKRMQEPVSVQRIDEYGARNCATQTAGKPQPTKILPSSKLGNFNWKTLQAKVNELDKSDNFTYKTQKKLAEGDMKMRNAMFKKLFYKKNPFSPRNLIVRTVLGKDKSSYGEPPMLYRPRLFL
ncbi:unnamed protein product [Chilo suppressalis]|uniref:Uncharacterized protein n=1 Tax=Chilo suppressalis TaxID=168631 RepID=A0ABN8BD31_CHISP|nr:unnamed protein product [Chilo suppressalis]